MNRLLKNKPRRLGVATFLTAMLAASAMVSAGEKKHAGDDFQLTLSNKVYTGDPQSQFVRQTCERVPHKKVSAKKAQPSKLSLKKTKSNAQ